MAKSDEETVEPELVYWLVELARADRETYRKLREFAWELVRANPESSVNPNERS